MKRFFVASAFILSLLTVQAETRTWTNDGGKTLEAKLVKATEKNATVKLANGKSVTLKLNALSTEDQEYVSSWLKEEADKKAEAEKDKKKANMPPFKWDKSYKKALEQAKEHDLPLVILFTGTAWCGYCVKLEEEVFSKSEFKKLAKGKFLGVKFESPAASVGIKGREGQELAKKFGVSGYPKYIIVDGEGNQIGGGGYSQGINPESFVKRVQAAAGK